MTRGELSLILQRYEDKIVKKHIGELADEIRGDLSDEVEEDVGKFMEEYDSSNYFDTHIQRIIDNTLAYQKTDYAHKTLLIMAESGLKKLSEVPKEKLEQKEANLPKGYTLYQALNDEQIQDDYYPPYYLNYKATESSFMGDYDVDHWYGPFSSYNY